MLLFSSRSIPHRICPGFVVVWFFLIMSYFLEDACELTILGPEAGISGMDKRLHPTEYCGMQLLIPAWGTLAPEAGVSGMVK